MAAERRTRQSAYSRARLTTGTELPAPAEKVEPPWQKVRRAILLKDELKDRFNLRNRMMSEMRRLIDQERKVPIPAPFRQTAIEVRLPLLADLVELMAAIVDDAEMRVHVDPYDDGPVAKRNSGVRERWSEAVLDQTEDEIGRNVRSMAARNQVADGLSVIKVFYRPASWRDLPTDFRLFGRPAGELSAEEARQLADAHERAKKGARLPFGIVDVDPITYLPSYGPEGEVQAVVELTERPIRDVLLAHGDRLALDRSGKLVSRSALGEPHPYDNFDRARETRGTVEFWEYTDLEDTIIFVEDVPIAYDHHRMGMVPYFEAAARPNPSRQPERATRPPAYKQWWMLNLLDQLWTMAAQTAFMFSYPTPVTETPLGVSVPRGQDGRPDATRFEPGKHLVLWQGQRFTFATPPIENLRFMSELIAQAQRLYEASSGLGPAIRGLGGSDQAGYAINQLMQASLFVLNPTIKARERQIARVIAYLWRLVEHRVQDHVWAWATNPNPDEEGKAWLKLGPADIGGYYRVRVSTRPLIDQLRIPRGQFAAAMVRSKLMDRRTAIEQFLGFEDPESIMDAIAVDEAMEMPEIRQVWQQAALKRAGLLPPSMQPPSGGPDFRKVAAGLGDIARIGGQPAGPGLGMPFEPPAPSPPAPSAGQVAELGSSAMPPGRAAGAARQPPAQPPANLYPEGP